MAKLTDEEVLIDHYEQVTGLFMKGRVVPFLGAGANLCGRPPDQAWPASSDFLPNATELATYLRTGWRGCEETDLIRVAQWVAEMGGSGGLFNTLHDVFDRDYPPTRLHRFLAELPAMLQGRTPRTRYPLIVTTNYDDLLEQALRESGQPFDLLTYVSDGDDRGKFIHTPPGEEPRLINSPNDYHLPVEQRTAVLKIHGAVKRNQPDGDSDSYVITEDHYIDYLSRTQLTNFIPSTIAAKLKTSHILFLGYALRDWNMRVILYRIAGEQKLTYQSWAIQRNPTNLDLKFWDRRAVDILDIDLEQYISRLRARLHPSAGGTPGG